MSCFTFVPSSWSVIDDVAKFTLYLRWSIYCGLVTFLAAAISPALQGVRVDVWPPYSAVSLLALLLNMVVAIVAVGRIPEFSTQTQVNISWIKSLGISLVVATEIGVGIAVWQVPELSDSDMVAAVSFFAFICFALVYSAFVRFPFIYSIGCSLVVVVLVNHEYMGALYLAIVWASIMVLLSRTSLWSA